MSTSKAKVQSSRREFLAALGSVAPTLTLLPGSATADLRVSPEDEDWGNSGKFSPIDLSAHFNASSRDFGPREISAYLRDMAVGSSEYSEEDKLIRVPGGHRTLQGMPFLLGPEQVDSKSWIVLSKKSGSPALSRVETPSAEKPASFASHPLPTSTKTNRRVHKNY
jgi:hypothetical protein